jgi:hypothetical protein
MGFTGSTRTPSPTYTRGRASGRDRAPGTRPGSFDEQMTQGHLEEIDDATEARARLAFIAWYQELSDAGISP